MTGVEELRPVHVVSAAPEAIRVSVVGGRTQLDVALPADVPVAAFLPELARLIKSRDDERSDDLADRDERRTFWELSREGRAGTGVLQPDRTLREAGVKNGELLRLSARRALSPPALYDDVVDAAARLNRASYAAWSATAARMMAFAGLWLCAAVWVVLLLAPALSAHRAMILVAAALMLVTLVAGAALARRVLARSDIAAAAGPPVIAVGTAAGWVLAAPHGAVGLAATCAILLGLTVICHRVIAAGHWTYVAAAVLLGFGTVAFGAYALGVPVPVVATVTSVVAVFACLAVPALTARLDQYPVASVVASRGDDPFAASAATDEPGTPMPSAEQVWDRVHSAVLTRSGLLAGAATTALIGTAAVLRVDPDWAAFAFALGCGAVLALHSRRAATWPERAALAVPAGALVLAACVQAQSGVWPLQLTGVVVLAVVAVGGVAAPYLRRFRAAAGYLEYLAVAAVIPLALWPLGLYERLAG
ncbi:type VII secretion integral membrane protein EccD [Mycolicibacterium boenickei]|uniref:Type VII secretion integral membrane protein EccD n=1 Tax=Mycolicibacterium boenickei TaxID=146017 RepID=A0AAX2ZWB8_9MYCO|nr:type VII secretion integral membrane protein EccD [Mycolicibacterium boenickei]UNB99429.1 type VII secretion integral membrane protein EccD [Mycolicibacterium boenickei]BBX89069.1 type VII secretion integral membrane protein EccD [Mycolicibacterium boenickei]